jgi:tungstate transport system substrate-binding protein
MKRSWIFPLLLLIASLSLNACSPSTSASRKLLLISTTSTQDSGLLDVLLPAFEKQTGYQVQLVSVGSGQALQMAEQGNADVLLVHSPAAEKDFMAQGFGIDRRLVMHNDFVLVGPPSDPAGIKGEPLIEALKAIYGSGAIFVSRSDQSGTNVKELALWKTAGLDPTQQSWYLQTGQGQGATLSIASEKGGYALTDRGTFLAYQSNIESIVLVEADPDLLNVYHVITVNPEKWPKVNAAGARAFADYVTSPAGQQVIRDFGLDKYGQPLFYPDAGKTDAELGLP